MKLLRLDLLAFGPFTKVVLDLDSGNHGFHLVYGPNEAGKSSTLRALRQLFYGIPERTDDSFLHAYDRLRIGGKIRHSDGTILEFIRRKARKNPLRASDDKTIVDDTQLDRFLGNVSEQEFTTTFGIDHQALVAGGKEILKGRDQIGATLFATAAGIGDLRGVQENLQSEMDKLYKSAGRNQEINKLILEYRETEKKRKKAELSSDEWQAHDRELRQAEQRREQTALELQKLRQEHHRLTRLRDALPGIAQRKELLAQLEACADAVLLPPDFSIRRQHAMTELRLAEDQRKRAQQVIETIDPQLEEIEVPVSLLEKADTIERLYRKLGEYEKDVKDRPERDLQRKTIEHEAKEILKSLGRPDDLGKAEEVRLQVNEPLKIQNLGNDYQGLAADLRNASETVKGIRESLESCQQEINSLDKPKDTTELHKAIRLAQKQGDLDEELNALQRCIATSENQLEIELAKMAPWSGTIEDLEKLAVPAPESLDAFEAAINKKSVEVEKLRDRINEADRTWQDLANEIKRLEFEENVPSENDVAEARQMRDSGWQLVRRAWLDKEEPEKEIAEFLAAMDQAKSLADAYERSVERADHTADRLRREADRVAVKAKLLADQVRHAGKREKLSADLEKSKKELEGINADWHKLWQPVHIEPQLPQEMRAWLRKQTELARQASELRESRSAFEQLEEKINIHRNRLNDCLRALDEKPTSKDESLQSLLEQAIETAERWDAVGNHFQQLQSDLSQMNKKLDQAVALENQAEQDMKKWQSSWEAAMSRIGLSVQATPSEAYAVLASIDDLFSKLGEADGFRRRIEGMDRDMRQYTDAVKEVAGEVAPDLLSLGADRIVEELNVRLKAARSTAENVERLQEQRETEQANVTAAKEKIAKLKIELDAMCKEAQCSAYDQLQQAEQLSSERRRLENELQQTEKHLLTLSAGAPLDEFAEQAEQVDADAANAELQQLSDTISKMELESSQLNETIGGEKKVLEQMGKSAEAAEEAERQESLIAQLETGVEEYVRLRLAAAVLREGIKRYRDKNQAPVVERARRLFTTLTCNSFSDLQIDFDDQGEPTLVGIRSGSQEQVPVEQGMSDGTSDQLYLALRLGYLQLYFENHEPIPFIADDILLNFDDQRAVAALKALAELSKTTQVIFFTHHEHIVQLAEKELPSGVLHVHRLRFPHVGEVSL